MDTCIWGPPLWSLRSALIRVLYLPYDSHAHRDHEFILHYKKNLLLFLYSLRYVLPCVYCRDSYRLYLRAMPPENEQDLVEWEWKVHNEVNMKLERTCGLSLEKFQKRMMVWTTFMDPMQLWDVITVLSLNYPKLENKHEDREFLAKRAAYHVFFQTLSKLLPHVTGLRTLASYVSPENWTADDTRDRSEFFHMISSLKVKWARETGKCELDIQAMQRAEHNFVESLL